VVFDYEEVHKHDIVDMCTIAEDEMVVSWIGYGECSTPFIWAVFDC
jgi:hypothetical protein